MSGANFSPGPWHIEIHEGEPLVYNEEGIVTGVIGDHPPEQDVINAHLIATAPELYEALEAVVDWFDGIHALQKVALQQGYEAAEENWNMATLDLGGGLDVAGLRHLLAKARGEK